MLRKVSYVFNKQKEMYFCCVASLKPQLYKEGFGEGQINDLGGKLKQKTLGQKAAAAAAATCISQALAVGQVLEPVLFCARRIEHFGLEKERRCVCLYLDAIPSEEMCSPQPTRRGQKRSAAVFLRCTGKTNSPPFFLLLESERFIHSDVGEDVQESAVTGGLYHPICVLFLKHQSVKMEQIQKKKIIINKPLLRILEIVMGVAPADGDNRL